MDHISQNQSKDGMHIMCDRSGGGQHAMKEMDASVREMRC
jgi:hypothetical protein